METVCKFLELASGAGWPVVALLVIGFAITLYIERTKRKQIARDAAEAAHQAYLASLENDPPEQIVLKRKRWERLAKIAGCIIFCITPMIAGCASTRLIPIGTYVQTPAEGDVVPALPQGETRWLLLSTPTGAELILGDKGE